MYIPLRLIPKEGTVHRWRFYKLGNWQTKLLETWKVIQLTLLRQKSIQIDLYVIRMSQRANLSLVFSLLKLAADIISRVPDQNGISQLYNMLEIHRSGLELSIFSHFLFLNHSQNRWTKKMRLMAQVAPQQSILWCTPTRQ